jgi:hypothetical protein
MRDCLKTNLLIVAANLPAIARRNRPQVGFYTHKALILREQFFDSLLIRLAPPATPMGAPAANTTMSPL